MKRNGAYTRRTVRASLPAAVVEPCSRCGKLYRWHDAGRTCEPCSIRLDGFEPKGTCADGSLPVLYRLQGRDGAPTVYQRCTSCDTTCEHASLDGAGLCRFCRLPGQTLRTFTGATIGKVWSDVLFVPDNRGGHAYTVLLASDGTVPVLEYVQATDPRPRSVRPGETPAWGRGWQVEPTDGARRWWLTNWDSSD